MNQNVLYPALLKTHDTGILRLTIFCLLNTRKSTIIWSFSIRVSGICIFNLIYFINSFNYNIMFFLVLAMFYKLSITIR